MKPICRNGWSEKRNTDGDQPSSQEKESSIVQIVDVIDETFHIGRPQVRLVRPAGGQKESKFETEPQHPKGKSNHEAPKGSRLIRARPEDSE